MTDRVSSIWPTECQITLKFVYVDFGLNYTFNSGGHTLIPFDVHPLEEHLVWLKHEQLNLVNLQILGVSIENQHSDTIGLGSCVNS